MHTRPVALDAFEVAIQGVLALRMTTSAFRACGERCVVISVLDWVAPPGRISPENERAGRKQKFSGVARIQGTFFVNTLLTYRSHEG